MRPKQSPFDEETASPRGAGLAVTRGDVLPSPRIETLSLDFYEGNVDDPIMLVVAEDFGISSVCVILEDENGNVIESGDADPFRARRECWSYVAKTTVPSGTSVTVRATATDCLGGVGILSTSTTIASPKSERDRFA